MNITTITLGEVLASADKLAWSDALYLPVGTEWNLATAAVVWDPDDVDDDSEIPDVAKKLEMRYVLPVSSVQDVVRNFHSQKDVASVEDLLRAFMFYFQNDAFIEVA